VSKFDIVDGTNGVKPSGFYVYTHRRLTDGLVMHVGKGSNNRYLTKNGRNEYWEKTTIKHGIVVEILREGMSEVCSLTLEKIIIAKYRALGHPLTNMTDGGQGISGFHREKTFSERAKLRDAKGAAEICCSNGMVFNTSRDAAEWVTLDRGLKSFASAINLACSGGIFSAYGYSWWRYGDDVKDIIDGRVEFGKRNKKKIIRSDGVCFDSASDGAQHLISVGLEKSSASAISACCNGKIGSAYGYSWWYDGDEPKEYIPRYVRSAASNTRKIT